MVPYVCMSTAVFPIKASLSHLSEGGLDASLAGYATSLIVPWANPIGFFWFLPTLFFASSVIILALTIVRVDHSIGRLVLVGLAACSAFGPLLGLNA